MARIDNPRKKALGRLRAKVQGQMTLLGMDSGMTAQGVETTSVRTVQGPVEDLTGPGSAINDPTVWTGELADAQHLALTANVGSLTSSFEAIVSQVDTECAGMDDQVEADSPEGKWPSTS